MATVFTHAFVGAAIGTAYACGGKPKEPSERLQVRFWLLCALVAALPDIDAIGFHCGVAYGSMFGHRGFTHSLLFALLLAAMAAPAACRSRADFARRWQSLIPLFFLAAASHALLDAATNGGFGVAFFAPLENSRYFLRWRPIEAAHLGIVAFLSEDGSYVLGGEFMHVWMPTAILTTFILTVKSMVASTFLGD